MSSIKRAASRRRKVLRSFSVGLYSKLVAVVVSFMMVPLAVDYLGVEGYGLWVAVSSLIAMLSFVDGGAGNALVNMVSHATGANSNRSLKAIVSSGFFVLLVISIIGAFLFLLGYSFIPWAWVFGVSGSVSQETLQMVVLIVGLSFFFGLPVSMVGNVQRGFQEGNIEAFWNAKGRLLSLIFVYLAIQLNLGLVGFACGLVTGPIMASFANSLYYFYIKRKDVSPIFSAVNKGEVKCILGTGGLFFVLQITSAIQMQGDNIIIANMLGPAAVSQYAICMQLFMVVPMFMGLLWAPLWPAYREALASGDVDWIKRVFFKSLKLAFLVGIPSALVLVLFGKDIIRLWVGDDVVVPSMLLLVGCGLWLIFALLGGVLAMFLNAVQWLKVQISIAVCAGILNVFTTISLIDMIGVEGAIYGSLLSYLVCALIPYSILIPKYIAKITPLNTMEILISR